MLRSKNGYRHNHKYTDDITPMGGLGVMAERAVLDRWENRL